MKMDAEDARVLTDLNKWRRLEVGYLLEVINKAAKQGYDHIITDYDIGLDNTLDLENMGYAVEPYYGCQKVSW